MEYSDAYDMANQPEAESGLLINPAVKAAVESQFAVVASVPHKKGETKVCIFHSCICSSLCLYFSCSC